MGNVGIGTATPVSLFEMVGSSPVLRITSSSGSSGAITTGVSGMLMISIRFKGGQSWRIGTKASSGYFTIANGADLGTNPRLTIDNSGLVGINTTTPGRTLTVVGDIRATGILYDSANAAGSGGNFLMSTATGYQWTATSTLFGGSQVTGSGTNGFDY